MAAPPSASGATTRFWWRLHSDAANVAMQNLLADLSARLTITLGSAPAGHLAALEQLRAIAYREASALAYADAFRTIMVAFQITTPLALLLRKVAAPQRPSGESH